MSFNIITELNFCVFDLVSFMIVNVVRLENTKRLMDKGYKMLQKREAAFTEPLKWKIAANTKKNSSNT